jgi:hypothetical protein
MRDKELYAQILCLKSPRQVSGVEVSDEAGEMGVSVEIAPGTSLCCPKCGEAEQSYDHRSRR